MEQTPPFRSRPNLQLKFTALRRTMSAQTTSQLSPFSTPLASTDYSPFHSASLKPPIPYGGVVQFTPRITKSQSQHHYGNRKLFRIKKVLASRALLCILIIISLLCWWGKGWREELETVIVGANELGIGSQLFEIEATKELKFFPASNPKIHVRTVLMRVRHPLTANSILEDGWQHRIDCVKTELSLVSRSKASVILRVIIDRCP